MKCKIKVTKSVQEHYDSILKECFENLGLSNAENTYAETIFGAITKRLSISMTYSIVPKAVIEIAYMYCDDFSTDTPIINCSTQDIVDATDAIIYIYEKDNKLYAYTYGTYPYRDTFINSIDLSEVSVQTMMNLIFGAENQLRSFRIFDLALEYLYAHDGIGGCIYAKVCNSFPRECGCAAEKNAGGFKLSVYDSINRD